MRVLVKLACLALFVAFVSCSGNSVPTVRDYTSANPTRNVNPQSVIARCPPNQYPCVGGGGGGGGGGIYANYNPDNCESIETDCQFVPNDYADDISYSDGQGASGTFTAYPWDCALASGSSTQYVSVRDGLPCDAWQVYHYLGVYCSGSCASMGPSGPGDITSISVGISPAGSSYGDVPGEGHLYIQIWSYGYAQGNPLQAGNIGGKLGYASFTQHPVTDAHYYLPISVTTAVSLANTLQSDVNTYNANFSCCAPPYDPLFTNSNTWADALLRTAGVSQTNIDMIVNKLTSQSGLTPTGWDSGSVSLLMPLF